LGTAIRVALAANGQLTVMLIADTPEQAQRLQEDIDVSLQARQVQGHSRQLITPTAEELAKALQLAGGGTLILAADNPLLEGEGLPTLLDAIDCSVILIR
jgi:hypothetical protein